MKRNIVILVLCCFLIVISGCTKNEPKQEHRCVKCGGVATTTLSGPAEYIVESGISLSECEKITQNVYSAYVCDSCVGPVVELKPW